METVDVSFAKARLSMLVDRATKGEAFVTAKRGKSLVKVVAIDAPQQQPIGRLGFLEGRMSVPDDFDTMFIPDPAQASLLAIAPCLGAKAKSQTRLIARAARW